MVSGTRRTRRDAALLLGVVAFSAYLRVRFADRASWGVDEAAPLWLATALGDGEAPLLGMPSSTGVPHPAGATLFLIPFAWLRDLTHVSIALSFTQLVALVALGWQLGRDLGSGIWAIALLTPGDALWRRYDYFVPPGEMREVVDWIAEPHRTGNPGESVDVRYALALRREWVPDFARRHAAPFYSIGRPFDWLLRRRHGMRNANEGRYERGGSGAFEVRYRRDPEVGAEDVQRFEYVAVRWNASRRSPH